MTEDCLKRYNLYTEIYSQKGPKSAKNDEIAERECSFLI